MYIYPRDDPEYKMEFDALHKKTCAMLDDANKHPDVWYRQNVARPAIYRLANVMQDALQQRFGLPPMQVQKSS